MITLIIPKPQKIDYFDGKFILDNNTAIYTPKESSVIVKSFVKIIKRKYTVALKIVTESRENNIIILESDFNSKDENEEEF